MTEQCRGTTKAGAPCKARLNLSLEGFCIQHDEKRREEAAAMHAAGGRAHRGQKIPKRAPAKPETLDDIAQVQAWVAQMTYTGQMDARTSEATTKALRNQQLIIEKRDLQAEIAHLRHELAESKRKRV